MVDDATNGDDSPVTPAIAPADLQAPAPLVEPDRASIPLTADVPVVAPSVPSTHERTRAAALIPSLFILVAVWVPLQLWGLSATPFHTKGEPREALMVQSIVRDRQWIVPRRNAVELPAKPPLFHWLGAAVSFAAGQVNEGTVRLPSAICSLAAAAIVLAAGSTLWGAFAGIIAALTLLTSFEWLRAATGARVDMTLTLGLTAALCGLLVLHTKDSPLARAALWIGSAWAVLSKGPVGLALPLLVALAMTIVDRNLHVIRSMRLVRLLVIVAVLAGVWYGLAFATAGPDFFRKQILTENVWRFVGTSHFTEGHRHSVLYLLAMLVAGCLPWIVFFPAVGAALWRTRRMIGRHDPQTFLLVWIVVVFAFYSIASSKRGVYLLALYPALFLLLGWWVDMARRSVVGVPGLARMLPPIAWGMAWLCGMIAVCAALAHVGFPIADALPDLLSGRTGRDARSIASAIGSNAPITIALFVAAAAAAACAAVTASRQSWGLLVIFLVAATATVAIGVRRIALPALASTMSRGPFVDTVRGLAGPQGQVAAYRSFDYGFVYYWGAAVPVQSEPGVSSIARVLVASDDQWALATPVERRAWERVPFIESPRGTNTERLIVLQRREVGSSSSALPRS